MIKKPEVGILFVHGIGEQNIGQTLTDFGEPICQWLDEWLSNEKLEPASEGGPGVQITQASLSLSGEQACPHFFADLRVKNDDKTKQEGTWLFAESYWAESFPLPGPQEVTLWLMRVVPWTCLSYPARRIRMAILASVSAFFKRKWLLAAGRILRLPGNFLMPFFLLPLIWLIELLLVALVVIGSIPIPLIRSYVSWIQTKLSAVIGDSYAFASSLVRRESAVSKLRADIDWIEKQCENLVIVAHSQGAALAYLALKRSTPKKLRLFVTFGSGLKKLSQLTQPVIQQAQKLAIAFLTLICLIPVAALIEDIVDLYSKEFIYSENFWTNGLLFIFLTVIVLVSSMVESNEDIKKFGKQLVTSKIGWMDIYSSSDPVPNGPLFMSDQPFLESTLVYNERSIFTDHTTYLENREGFLSTVVNGIAKHGATSLPIISQELGNDQFILNYKQEVRRIRTFARKLSRFFMLAALVLTLLNKQALVHMGSNFDTWINRICMAFSTFLGKESIIKCWTIPNWITGILVFTVLYLIITKLVYLIEKSLSKSFLCSTNRHRSSSDEKFILLFGFKILFFFLSIGFIALSLSIHLYISEHLQITRVIIDFMSLGTNYILWQGILLGFALALIACIGYEIWMLKFTYQLRAKHGV